MAPEEGHSPQDKMLAMLDLSRYFQKTRGIDRQRQAVLEAAIDLAKQTMSEPCLDQDDDDQPHFYDRFMYPSAEFLNLLLQGNF